MPGDAEALLLAERAELLAAAGALDAEIAAIVAASETDNADDEHDPEGSTIAFERAQLAAVLSSTVHRLAEVDAARQRLSTGGYGDCQVCGRPIGDERLTVRPASTRCVLCA